MLDGPVIPGSAGGLELARCRVRNAQWTSSHLVSLQLRDVVIEHSDLSGAILEQATLTRVRVNECRLSGVELARSSFRDVLVVGSRLDQANLRMCHFERVTFDGVDLQAADFTGTTFAKCRLFDCNLTGADFSKVKAEGARLHGSVLEGIKGADSLRGVVIDSTQMVPLGVRLLATMAIAVDDQREPEPPRRERRPGR